jgi:hypothetical protein
LPGLDEEQPGSQRESCIPKPPTQHGGRGGKLTTKKQDKDAHNVGINIYFSLVLSLQYLFSHFSPASCQAADMLNGKGQNVYRLPPPTSCPLNPSGDPVNLRIPSIEKPIVSKVLYNICYA